MAFKTYKGKYKVKKPEKYLGDYTSVTYRSLWERQAFKWCEERDDIIGWQSEETIVPYRCKTDNKMHRYFIDLKIKFSNGRILLVEIKPKCQTIAPKKPARQTKRYLNEVMTYIKNECKWKAASKYAKDRGYHFEIWTEDTLTSLGIKLLLKG
tara:strand:+ start:3070 stop:3528 length:459 start_codon:yes stop_codon:yes gene_type:complete